jgi:hypothetical protein
MRTWGTAGRLVALQLLIAAPLAVGGRLALDVRPILDGLSHVEVEHCACCATAHDHKVCTLVYQPVWSPAYRTPRIAHRQPSVDETPGAAGLTYDDGATRHLWARGPPAST